MWWIIKWLEYNPETEEREERETDVGSWAEVMKKFLSCIDDTHCEGCTVYTMVGNHEYTDDPIVLTYRP